MANYFEDRIVEHPGRVTLAPVSGQANVYDMTRTEGNVTEPGTPFDAATFNAIADDIIQTADDNIITDTELSTLRSIVGAAAAKLYEIIQSIGERTVANKSQTRVTLDSYTSNDYTFPSDGYLFCTCGANQNAQASVALKDANGTYLSELGGLNSGSWATWAIFVKKGMKCRATVANDGHVYFSPMTV